MDLNSTLFFLFRLVYDSYIILLGAVHIAFFRLFTLIMPRKPGTLCILLGFITKPEARMDFVIIGSFC